MKGRRKVKTDKWRIKSENEDDARRLLRRRVQTQGRFLDIAAHAGKGMECSGLMKPDTHLGENARHREVSDDQATSYLYP